MSVHTHHSWTASLRCECACVGLEGLDGQTACHTPHTDTCVYPYHHHTPLYQQHRQTQQQQWPPAAAWHQRLTHQHLHSHQQLLLLLESQWTLKPSWTLSLTRTLPGLPQCCSRWQVEWRRWWCDERSRHVVNACAPAGQCGTLGRTSCTPATTLELHTPANIHRLRQFCYLQQCVTGKFTRSSTIKD